MHERPNQQDALKPDVDPAGLAPNFAASTALDEAGRAVVAVVGDVDLASRDQLWAEIEPVLDTPDGLVIDLAGATFLDSIGLNLILRATRERSPELDQLVLRSPSDAVTKLLRITGVDGVVTVEAAESAA